MFHFSASPVLKSAGKDDMTSVLYLARVKRGLLRIISLNGDFPETWNFRKAFAGVPFPSIPVANVGRPVLDVFLRNTFDCGVKKNFDSDPVLHVPGFRVEFLFSQLLYASKAVFI